jgi:uncharacterized membrane protein YbaN (DUF454 family)
MRTREHATVPSRRGAGRSGRHVGARADNAPMALTPRSSPASRSLLRALWFAGGALSLLAAFVGVLLPLWPTVPFLLLALLCFSRSCARCERRMLEHPRWGPLLRDWRAHRAVPLRAKQWATVTMAVSSFAAWWVLSGPQRWLPAGACALVAVWLWRLPTRPPST